MSSGQPADPLTVSRIFWGHFAFLYVLLSLSLFLCEQTVLQPQEHPENRTSSAMSAVSSSNTAFALELFRTLSQANSAGNIFVSPLSISSALAMVYLGAKGDTAAQMAQALSFSSGEGVHADFQKLNHDHGLQILELPYVNEELSMFVLLPAESSDGSDPLLKLEKELTQERLNEWTDRKNMDVDSEVVVHLPKFKLEEDYELNDPLAKLGMKNVFCAGSADLSGMNGEGGLFLSTVAHKAFVEVNEEGTEAAAATAGMVAFCMLREEHFTADHPFLFFIRHNKTKSILFFGRFSSPQ
ncbi:leukocyte elastase inhibitor-like [Pundamilia nyererei]|uniref:Leukocyte elastase inhibitor-like n=1 Tax=Pundamilia nyererei TaxID=303518 RepID=A0A9Y3RNS2_9CICH|nr:PREDICTED: leukocyte elastase inhibitor-like [Pundamilia nyererei]